MGYLTTLSGSFNSLVKSAGGVFYYDARKDYIAANGVTPDRSGQSNDVTWSNFAGTAASGLINESGKISRIFDGTDDFGSLVNTASVDITSAPLAVFATIKYDLTGASGYVFCKNVSSALDIQYAIYYNIASQLITIYLEGAAKRSTANSSVLTNTWYDIGFIWDGTNVHAYVNGVKNGTIGAYSGTLTSRANVRIGRRETPAAYLKGNIATLTIYAGAKATETNILKAERQLSKAYI